MPATDPVRRSRGARRSRRPTGSPARSMLRGVELAGARPARPVLRQDAGIWAYENALARAGFPAVAGTDEAGRGACAGPLVVAACLLPPGLRVALDGLADSKLLSAADRERYYDIIVRRATAYAVVSVSEIEIDAFGLHVANVSAMRRAVHQLHPGIDYALTDGFPVAGLGVPTTAVWKGDAVVACIAAASVLAKVTRDRIMIELHEQWPQYEFAQHKGYVTAGHTRALREHGPSPVHRQSYVNVRRARAGGNGPTGVLLAAQFVDDNEVQWDDTVGEDIA